MSLGACGDRCLRVNASSLSSVFFGAEFGWFACGGFMVTKILWPVIAEKALKISRISGTLIQRASMDRKS